MEYKDQISLLGQNTKLIEMVGERLSAGNRGNTSKIKILLNVKKELAFASSLKRALTNT